MLGLDAAGKTSEFLSCPKLVQDCSFGGLDMRERTCSIRRGMDVRDGCALELSRFQEGYTDIHDPHFFNLSTALSQSFPDLNTKTDIQRYCINSNSINRSLQSPQSGLTSRQ